MTIAAKTSSQRAKQREPRDASNVRCPGLPKEPRAPMGLSQKQGEAPVGRVLRSLDLQPSPGHGEKLSCLQAGNRSTVEGGKPLFLHLKMGIIIVFSHSLLVMRPWM